MATIEAYQTADGKRYQVRYPKPQRTQTKKRGFRTKRDAQEFAATVEVENMTGQYVAPSLGMITVSELASAWLSRKESDVAPSNYRTLEAAWRIHVKPVWGTTRVADVDFGAVELWIAAMGKTSGATVVIRAYGVLAGILDDAVKARRLAANPARGVENLPKRHGKRHVYCPLRTSVGWLTSPVIVGCWCSCWHTAACDGVGRSHCGYAMLSSCGDGCRCTPTPCRSALSMRSGQPRDGWRGPCRCRPSCWMSWRCSARAAASTISCSATAIITCHVRSPRTDGLGAPSKAPGCRP
jgi:hypothetical protein